MTRPAEAALCPDASRRRVGSPWLVMATVLAGTLGYGSTMTILSASLKVVAEDLAVSETVLAWAATGPFLGLAVGTPVFGKLGDIHGHRRVFLGGLAVFAASTILSGLAWNAPALIVARTIAGLGGSAMIPNGLALILVSFPVHQRARAMGWFQFVGTGAPALGLAVGGILVETFSWRVIFGIYGPVSIAALVLAWVTLPRDVPGRRVRIDLAGAASLAAAAAGLLIAIDRGDAIGWTHPLTLALLATGPVAIAAFVHAERRAPDPLVPLGWFRRANFAGPLAGASFVHFSYMGGFIVTPLLLQDRYGYGLGLVTLILLSRLGSFSLSSPAGGWLVGRVGERRATVFASVLMIVSMGLFTLGSSVDQVLLVIAALVLSGCTLGLGMPSYQTALAASVDDEDLGVANGMMHMMISISTASGIQVMLLLLGGGREPADFARSYLFGAAVAVLALLASLVVRPTLTRPIRHQGAPGARQRQ